MNESEYATQLIAIRAGCKFFFRPVVSDTSDYVLFWRTLVAAADVAVVVHVHPSNLQECSIVSLVLVVWQYRTAAEVGE